MPLKRRSASSAPAAQQSQRQKLVEEFARLDAEVSNFKPQLFRHEKLRRLILDWHKGTAPDEEITVPGISCDVLISARDNIRSVTWEGKKKLFMLWGQREFIARAEVMLKSLPDPKDEAGLYTVQALIGPRHLHVIKRVQSAASAA